MLSDNLHIKGWFNFSGDPNSKFVGPIKGGSRFIAWISSKDKSTSCAIISSEEVLLGQTKIVEFVLLASFALDSPIKEDLVLSIGSPKTKIGELKIQRVLGQWKGKVP